MYLAGSYAVQFLGFVIAGISMAFAANYKKDAIVDMFWDMEKESISLETI